MHDERRWLAKAVWFVGFRRRVILTVTRDSSALDCISTNPETLCMTAKSADAIALPMAFDVFRFRCHVPRHFE